jgi:hypothetical protein
MARCGGALIAVAALAACSGNQAVTPMTTAFSPQARPIADAGHQPQVISVTGDNLALARTFRFGTPRIMYPIFKNPFAKAARSRTPGYPMDMSCPLPIPGYMSGKCTTMPSATAYNVYVSPNGKQCATESCWGQPEEFLKSITGTKFVGLITQYTGGKPAEYKYGASVAVKYPLNYSKVMYGNDIGNILAAAIGHFGKAGLTSEYHIFLPPGYDTCFDETNQCYSPNHPSTFDFCAYHTFVYVPGLETYVVFSIEPWAGAKVRIGGKNVSPCGDISPAATQSTRNFQAAVLAHESFESWSDPIQTPAASGNLNYYGMEIGDVCAYRYFTNVGSGSNAFNVQTMYSNAAHACNNQ